MPDDPAADLKRKAGEAAARLVETGMVVGLGTGSTAQAFIAALGARIQADGLRIEAIPTSERSAEQARTLGIELTDFSHRQEIDLTIDGADEVARGSLDLIKGLGGALLREKIVAAASRRLVIIVDESKLVDHLGEHRPVPVEVTAFGWQATAARLGQLGAAVSPRRDRAGSLLVTDGGNLILDCAFGSIADPASLERAIDLTVGVVEGGLFIGRASEVLVATEAGVDRLERA